MLLVLLRRYRTMILISVLFFYLGCGITLSFLRLECAEALLAKERNAKLDPMNKVEYGVLIFTGPDNESKRDAIRTTWSKLVANIFIDNGEIIYKWHNTWTGMHQQDGMIKYFFVIGTQGLPDKKLMRLETESHRSGDIILLDSFEDNYKNLTVKLLHSIKWVNNNMKNLKYLIKCDDDSFVRVDLIVKELDAYAPAMSDPNLSEYVTYKKSLPSYKGLYWGYFNGRAKVYLNGKWEETDWFLCDNYLPYALGGGYVISKSIVDYVGKNADHLSIYNSEDVSMGVWTAALDGINRVHDIRFDTEWKSRGCFKNMLIRHKQDIANMFKVYKTVVQSHGESICKSEAMDRKSYIYKWDVLPSQCCSIKV